MDHVPVLELGSDLRVRHRWFVPESLVHPAKLHLGLLQVLIDRDTGAAVLVMLRAMVRTIDPLGKACLALAWLPKRPL